MQYHPRKANVVADASSRKGQVNIITTHLMSQELCWEMEQLNLGMLNNMEATVMEVESTLEQKIRKVLGVCFVAEDREERNTFSGSSQKQGRSYHL